MYKIARGNNLGNHKSNLMESEKFDYLYTGDLSKLIEEDIIVLIAVLRVVNVDSIIYEEFEDWANNEGLEENRVSTIWKKKLSILKEKDIYTYNEVLKLLQKLQTDYSSMFETMHNLYSQLHEKNEIIFESNNVKKLFLTHTIPLTGIEDIDIEGLYSRKDLGIISSEWFGKLEKYGECRFCTSFLKTTDPFYKTENKNQSNSLVFIIDTTNPDLAQSIKLDYFEFCRNKQKNNLEIYTEEELKFLYQIYEWNNYKHTESPILQQLNGRDGNSDYIANEHPNWSAIPAGVPSQYITGIIANSDISINTAITAGKIFDVNVYDKEGKVIQTPENEKTM